MGRLSEKQLLSIKPGEGSYALQDAAAAARRRRDERKNPPRPIDNAALDRLSADMVANGRAAFDSLLAAIDGADEHGSVSAFSFKATARAALKKAYPQYVKQVSG